MFELANLIRPNIKALKAYSSARDEFSGKASVYLDANENPFGSLNRYPDPYQRRLKEKLSAMKGLATKQIFIGNGSDEIIDLCYRIFCRPGIDKALTFTPTYGMYRVSADINDVQLLELPLDTRFDLSEALVEEALAIENLKLIFLCSPNNPTGNTLNREVLKELLANFNGLVIIDEAYADFNDEDSWLQELENFPNLLVMQTLSKAYGLAAARIGMAFASAEINAILYAVKPPYNVSGLNQEAALEALQAQGAFYRNMKEIKKEKRRLEKMLAEIPIVKKIYPSQANFLLIEVPDANGLYKKLLDSSIVVRNRHSHVPNTLRITVGTAHENKQLLEVLRDA